MELCYWWEWILRCLLGSVVHKSFGRFSGLEAPSEKKLVWGNIQTCLFLLHLWSLWVAFLGPNPASLCHHRASGMHTSQYRQWNFSISSICFTITETEESHWQKALMLFYTTTLLEFRPMCTVCAHIWNISKETWWGEILQLCQLLSM